MHGCVTYATTGASPSRSSRQDAASCIRGVWSNVLVVRKKNALWSRSTAGGATVMEPPVVLGAGRGWTVLPTIRT